ncbi:MAG: hypothetical protein ACC662_05225, partial [Planctomycetota bacterium]
MARRGNARVLGAAVCGLGGGIALLLLAGTTFAHGGNFSPPPPSTPGRSTPLETPRSGQPTVVTPGVGGPIVTPGATGAMSPRPVGRRKTPVTPTYETSWRLWWRLNGERATPQIRAGKLRRMTVTPEGEKLVPPAADVAWVEARDGLVEKRIVPLLLGLLDPERRVPDDVRASAAIALGKLAFEPAHVGTLTTWLLDAQAPDIVRESAALALGLLRRSDPGRQLGAAVLDPVRATLLQVFDRRAGAKHLQVPKRTRYFALFAIGLLGDQPFHTDPLSTDGRLLTSLLWQRLTVLPHRDVDAPVALLTALGLQPRAGVPEGVLGDLGKMALGRKVRGRRYGSWVGAHALTALVRVGGARGRSLAIRALGDPRAQAPVRLAAMLAIGHVADEL